MKRVKERKNIIFKILDLYDWRKMKIQIIGEKFGSRDILGGKIINLVQIFFRYIQSVFINLKVLGIYS